MKKSKILGIILVLFLGFTKVYSQIDTVFWFAAPWVTPDHWWKDPIKFHVSSFGSPTTVRVRQPASTYDTTFTMPANSLVDVTYWITAITNNATIGYDSLETRPADKVRTTGFKISSNNPITVVYDVVTRAPNFYNPETFSLKGQNGLGKEFVTPFQTQWPNITLAGITGTTPCTGRDLNCDTVVTQPKQMFVIVASLNNTTVWIKPRCNVIGHPANITYSVFLPNAGDAYTCENAVQSTHLVGNSLSGSIVVSDKPISVTVSDDSVQQNAVGGFGCHDLMGDQIVPVDVIGTEYIVNLGRLNVVMNESAFIVASENFTQITINDGAVYTYTINKGDTKQFILVNPLTYIQTSKPVYVTHMSGFGCELGYAILPPLNCAGSNQVSFTRNNNQQFMLNILCKFPAIGTFTLNGSTALVTAAQFTVVPGTGGVYYGAQIPYTTAQIGVGTSNLLSNSTDVFAMGVFNGDVSTGGLYHYMSTFLRKVITTVGPDVNYCTGTNSVIPVSGTVTGGATTGSWTAINGSGTFGSSTSLTTNYTLSSGDLATGTLTLVLSSTGNCTPVHDTMLIHIRQSPQVDVGAGTTQCKNNITPIAITGTVTNALGSVWSGGTGSYGNTSALSTTYLPSPGDLTAGSVKIKLTSTGNIYGCPNMSDSLMIIFTDAPVVNAGTDVNVCTNNPTVALSGTVSVGTTTGIWSTLGSGAFVPTNTAMNTTYTLSASDLTQPFIRIKLTSTNNGLCNAVTDSITVTIIQKPFVNAGIDDTICASALTIPVNGTVSGSSSSGVWNTLGSGSFTNQNNLSTFYTMSGADTLAGVVQFVLSSSGGACPSVSDTVRYVILKAPLVTAGPDVSICRNAVIQLNGNITGFTNTGQWSSTGTGTFIPNTTVMNGVYQPSSGDITLGIIKLVLESTNNKGCNPSRDSITVTFIPSPTANFNFSTTCASQPITFTDTSVPGSGSLATYNWNFGDGSGSSISPNPIYSYTLANTYTVTHWVTSSNGCVDTVRKVLTVHSQPFANFTLQNPCEDSQTQFFDSSFVNPGNIIKWNWNFNDGFTDTTNKNPLHIYTSPGIYNVNLIVTSNNGCVNSINKAITVNSRPKAEFGMTSNPTLAQETLFFSDFSTPTGQITTWFWNFGDSITSNQQNPSHFYNNQGSFTITLTILDQSGCADTIRKEISVTLLPQVPTAFSPNSDGQNDLLFVKGGPFQNMMLRVYNSWGELLFETNDQTKGWDGTFKGEGCPVGVYVWVLDVDLYNNKSVRKTGDVTILR